MKEFWYDKVEVTKIVDGDTIKCRIDLGFGIFKQETFRLLNINAPEIRGKKRKEGLKSKKWLEKRLKNDICLNVTKQGKYGRYIVEIYDIDDNRLEPFFSINDEMVHEGFAEFKNYGGEE